jgi:4-amino-4-deoxy-L-arabinose transferase-like glycosyltransferase
VPIPKLATPAKAVIWILLYCALVGLTLDNTHPYQGDEAYYIKSAIGMLKSGHVLLPRFDDTIRLQKPILAYWLTALGYKTFGISLWAGRVLFLLVAAGLLILVYRFALLILPDPEFAYLSVVILSSSMLFVLFSRVSMTDLPLALFSTLALFFLYRGLSMPDRQQRDVLFACLATGARCCR